MLSHPTNSSTEQTLRDYLVKLYPDVLSWGEKNREGIVHRLDRVTSGLMVCALNLDSFNNLKGKFKNRDIQKKYIALIQGTLPSETGIIKLPLARSIQNRSKRIVAQKGRISITNYEVKYFDHSSNISKIELELVTGRNHQIRAHMEHMKTPVVNDTLYGASKNNLIPTDSIALHSASLKFNFDNEVLSFETNEPSFFNRVLDV